MIVSHDVPLVGRSKILLLQSETFEEERILKAIENAMKRGGKITIETESTEMTTVFNAVLES